MWISLAESVCGTSHAGSNTECQDYCEIATGIHNDPSAILFALSDGAGSAKYSAMGAKLVVSQFCERVRALEVDASQVTRETIVAVVKEIRPKLEEKAKEFSCDTRELAATLLAGCATARGSWFFQIGDGAICGLIDGAYTPITWPVNGEFANTTVFVSSADWETDCQFESKPSRVPEIAAFTDGMQDLILQHSDKSVHAPFLSDLFRKIRSVGKAQALKEPLRLFLDSKAVNERTDDDKTLVLSCWID